MIYNIDDRAQVKGLFIFCNLVQYNNDIYVYLH